MILFKRNTETLYLDISDMNISYQHTTRQRGRRTTVNINWSLEMSISGSVIYIYIYREKTDRESSDEQKRSKTQKHENLLPHRSDGKYDRPEWFEVFLIDLFTIQPLRIKNRLIVKETALVDMLPPLDDHLYLCILWVSEYKAILVDRMTKTAVDTTGKKRKEKIKITI